MKGYKCNSAELAPIGEIVYATGAKDAAIRYAIWLQVRIGIGPGVLQVDVGWFESVDPNSKFYRVRYNVDTLGYSAREIATTEYI